MAETRPRMGRDGGGLADYVVGAIMGDGLVGPRFAGRYRQSGHPVALEEIPHELLNRPDFVERLAQAGERAAGLEHPNAVSVYDLVRGDGKLYLVTELVRGRSLAALLAAQPALPLASALVVADSILAALEAAHSRAGIHGDVCPEAVLIAHSGEVLLTGFAIAEVLAKDPRMVGWPAVLPPEGGPATVSADLYATAALTRQAISGAGPEDPVRTIDAGAVGSVLDQATAEDPGQRLATATALREALDAAATGLIGEAWRGESDLALRVARPSGPQPRPRNRSTGAGSQRIPMAPPPVTAPPAVAAPPPPPPPLPVPPKPLRPAGMRVPAPPRRAPSRRSRRGVIAVLAAVLVGALVAAVLVFNPFTGAPANKGPLHVGKDVKLTVKPAQAGCDTTFNFTATGSVTGVGPLAFRWERSDGLNSPDLHVTITSDESSFQFTQAWRVQGHQQLAGTMTFRILSPQPTSAAQKITYAC